MLAAVSSVTVVPSGCTDQVRFVGSNAPDRQDKKEEEDGEDSEAFSGSGDDSEVPGKDGQLVQAGDEIPAGGRVSRDEDSERDNGECVHGGVPSRFRFVLGQALCGGSDGGADQRPICSTDCCALRRASAGEGWRQVQHMVLYMRREGERGECQYPSVRGGSML